MSESHAETCYEDHVVSEKPFADDLVPCGIWRFSCAFGGKDKNTLFVLARGATDAEGNDVANAAQVWSIQMIAQGCKGRAK